MEKNKVIHKKNKLWNRNFFLLWQGQLISMFGDALYSIAVGFWILMKTDSTAIMGVLMATTAFPRIFMSPIGGTFVDRHDRKKIIVITDIIRGLAITFIGLAAILGFIEVWMVIIAGLIMGICGSFFSPAIASAIPDIIGEEHLVKGNSALSLSSNGANIFGQAFGGIIFSIIGAPILFIVNGLSYLFSALTESFIDLPKPERNFRKLSFMEDMKEGLLYVNEFKGLKFLYATIAFLNFFGNMAMMLLIPMFNRVDFLNPKLYGIAMGILSAGVFMGFFSLSILNIDKIKKSTIFTMSGLISSLAMISVANSRSFLQIAIAMFISGFCVAVTNVMIQSSIHAAVEPAMRGKVAGFRVTMNTLLVPLALTLGGFFAEIISVRLLITLCYTMVFLMFLGLKFVSQVRDLINFKKQRDI